MNGTTTRLARWCLLALTCAALFTSSAQARHAPQDSFPTRHAAVPTHVTVDVSSGGGFNWADAGVGAAGALGGVLLLVGIGIPVRHGRQSRLAAVQQAGA